MTGLSGIQKLSHDHAILLYDGLCPFCHFTVRFVARRDKRDVFRFASIQSFPPESLPPMDRDSVMLLDGTKLYLRSEALTRVLQLLGGPYAVPAMMIRVFPASLADRLYDFVARNRTRWFGTYDECPLPPAGMAHKFINPGS